MVDKTIVDDNYVVVSVFDRVYADKNLLEQNIKQLAREFLKKYPAFAFENINVFDVYCDLKCVVNLKLK